MVTNQVVFTLLSYDLLQVYLMRQGRKDLTPKTPPAIRRQLLPSDNHIIVYWKNQYGLFAPLEFVEILTTLNERARVKVAEKARCLRRELHESFRNPRAP